MCLAVELFRLTGFAAVPVDSCVIEIDERTVEVEKSNQFLFYWSCSSTYIITTAIIVTTTWDSIIDRPIFHWFGVQVCCACCFHHVCTSAERLFDCICV